MVLLTTVSCGHGRAVLRVKVDMLTADVLCRETALEIASALAYLHSLNILHGDLSGGNILLTSSNKDSRKFTCKVPLPSASARSGGAALCVHHAITLRVLECSSNLVDLQGHPLAHVAERGINSPDTMHLHARTCRSRECYCIEGGIKCTQGSYLLLVQVCLQMAAVMGCSGYCCMRLGSKPSGIFTPMPSTLETTARLGRCGGLPSHHDVACRWPTSG